MKVKEACAQRGGCRAILGLPEVTVRPLRLSADVFTIIAVVVLAAVLIALLVLSRAR